MCGFIAQLVEHRTGIAEVTGSNPVEALIFFRLLLSSCLNWKIHCEDHSSLSYSRPVGLKEKRLDSSMNVIYLYAPRELEGGQKIATDPNWSLKVYRIDRSVINKGEPLIYYLKDGLGRGFVREELMLVPMGTELPPVG